MKTQGRTKLKTPKKAVPKHVAHSATQLAKMSEVIKNLLSPMADRFHIFELSQGQKKKAKRKQ